MSGSAVNQGGVKFEYLPGVDKLDIRWRARMRNHTGMGGTLEEAGADLIGQIEAELATAKAGVKTLKEQPR
jgi:hypothetical protein